MTEAILIVAGAFFCGCIVGFLIAVFVVPELCAKCAGLEKRGPTGYLNRQLECPKCGLRLRERYAKFEREVERELARENAEKARRKS